MTTRISLAGLASAIVLGLLTVQPTRLYADDCLSGPKGAAPKGSHWYYRVDRATKKNCWYVRAESKPTPAANSSAARALPQTDPPLQPSVANARAQADPAIVGQPDVATPEPAPFAGAGNIAEAPSAADQDQSAVASRWLDQPRTGTDNASPQPTALENPVLSTPPAVPLAASDIRSTSPAAFPPLLLVIVGALVAAGGVAGLLFRFGRARHNEPRDLDRRPYAPWDVMDIGATIRSPPLATEAASPPGEAVRERHEAVIPDEIVQLLSTLSKEAPA